LTKIFNEIRKLAEFEKDFKKLAKKFRTLDEDLTTFIANQLKRTRIEKEFLAITTNEVEKS